MAKVPSCGVLILVASILLNVYFGFSIFYVGGKYWPNGLSWAKRAAEEAEAVAAVSCSGHGRAYLDGLVLENEGRPVCECNTCYGGPDCSILDPDCAANADSGDPMFLEPFWMQHPAKSAVLLAGWHRMGYSFSDQSFISKELERHVRKLHAIVGNAVTEGRFVIFGAGSTQLLNAAVYALSPDNSTSPARVVASFPFYPLYQTQTEFFRSVEYKFEGDAALWKNKSNYPAELIEFVTSPNNPDGQLNKAILQGPNVKTIYDFAYFWPHYTAIPAPADEDVMIFTLSKLTGHAGSRLGWAIIKDEAIYQSMVWYMTLNTMGVSRESQLRGLKLLKAVIEEGGREIFTFGHEVMRQRWQRLSKTVSMSSRFSLQKIPPKYCTFYHKLREASPAYAWLKCEREEDKDCYAVLSAGNLIGRQGNMFWAGDLAGDRYVRLSLLRSNDDFDLIIQKLSKLVTQEDGPKILPQNVILASSQKIMSH